MSLLKYLSVSSFVGNNIYVLISFSLSLIKSLYYTNSWIVINYSIEYCVCEACSVVFFLIGTFGMYLFFIARVYYSFVNSSLQYSIKFLYTITSIFCLIMSIVGIVYMISLYRDFSQLGNVDTPVECMQFTGINNNSYNHHYWCNI